MAFGAARLREELAVEVEACERVATLEPDVLLVSHVLDELDASAWVRIGRQLGIDLRTLPHAFIALTRDRTRTGGERLLGRPKVDRRDAQVHTCSTAGLALRGVDRADEPGLFRPLKEHPEDLR